METQQCKKLNLKKNLFFNIIRLEYGEDSNGNICGQNNIVDQTVPKQYALDLTNKPYLYFPVAQPTSLNENLRYIKIQK